MTQTPEEQKRVITWGLLWIVLRKEQQIANQRVHQKMLE